MKSWESIRSDVDTCCSGCGHVRSLHRDYGCERIVFSQDVPGGDIDASMCRCRVTPSFVRRANAALARLLAAEGA